MPTYKFKHRETGKQIELFMSISACDQYLRDNPMMEQLINGFPSIGYSMVTKKPDDNFRDVLKEIKKNNSKGISKSNINTF